jgi:hypothetical protein
MLPDYLEVLERHDRRAARRAARRRLLRAPFVAVGAWLSTVWSRGASAFASSPFDDDDDGQSANSSFEDDWQGGDTGGDTAQIMSDGGAVYDHHDLSHSSINPATGLPMAGALDIGGNAYGCSETEWTGIHESEWWGS